MNEEFGIDVPRDAALRRALDNAPDRAFEPRHDVRRAIHLAAYRAVEPEAESIDLDESVWRMWWRRLRGEGGSGGRRPWTAAFATLLVAGIVTLLWQREPVPEAKLDSDHVARAPAPAAPPAEPAAPPAAPAPPAVPQPEPAPAPARAPEIAAAPAAPAAPATPAAPPQPSPGAPVAPMPIPAEPPSINLPPAPRASSRDELPADEVRESDSRAKSAAAAPPPAAAPAPAPAPPPAPPPAAAPAPAPVPPPAARKSAPPPPPPPSAVAPTAPPAPAAPAAPAAEATPPAGTGASERRAAARAREEAAAAPQQQRAAPPGARTDATEPPTFAALSQWRRVTILRTDGASRNLAREETGELAQLLGSAALAAVGPRPLPTGVEYRVVLERANGDQLAVLDIAGNWVRWREARLPPGTGAPGAGALAALREALREALER